MSKPVLLAGLLGGVLGALICFALMRAFPPPAQSATQTSNAPTAPSDGRDFANDIIAKMKAGKDEEIKSTIREAYRDVPDPVFEEEMWKRHLTVRKEFPARHGKSLGFELARETVIAPDIVRFTYIERFEHDCMVWTFVCYNSPGGWQVIAFRNTSVDGAFALLK